MATDKDLEKPFRFMDLPAELRNWSYDYMAVDLQKVRPKYSGIMDLYVKDGPAKALQLVSKQFGSEYMDRVMKSTHLQIRDHHACNFGVPDIPRPLKQYPLRDFYMFNFPDNGFGDIGEHVEVVKHIKSCDGLDGVVIRLYLEDYSKDDDSSLNEFVGGLIAVEGVSKLLVFEYEGCGEDEGEEHEEKQERLRSTIFQNEQTFLKCWTKTEGWKFAVQEARTGSDGDHVS